MTVTEGATRGTVTTTAAQGRIPYATHSWYVRTDSPLVSSLRFSSSSSFATHPLPSHHFIRPSRLSPSFLSTSSLPHLSPSPTLSLLSSPLTSFPLSYHFAHCHFPPFSPSQDEFRSTYGKSRQWGLCDLLGHVVAFCQDQHGSRFIQQRLEVHTHTHTRCYAFCPTVHSSPCLLSFTM